MAEQKTFRAEYLVAKPTDISTLIEYQSNSIVSKEILKNGVGTVTLFAFDAGQGLSEHTAPFDALVQIVDGEAKVLIAGNPHQLKNGQMIIMPANIPHALQAQARFKMILTLLKEKVS
ncbi:MAG: cupin domain-containing protein [Deltaproteobacteria bacterium]|nr:cupin domain-containing protein [Deltaproteobacteria bacterium]